MKRSKKSLLARPGYLLLTLIIILAIGWVHRAIVSGTVSPSADIPRIVVIGTEELHGTLVVGELPSGTHKAEVLSDRACAPDADGVSHCLNELAIGSTRLTIRHHHRMSKVPCLRPGETVTVMDRATYADRRVS